MPIKKYLSDKLRNLVFYNSFDKLVQNILFDKYTN